MQQMQVLARPEADKIVLVKCSDPDRTNLATTLNRSDDQPYVIMRSHFIGVIRVKKEKRQPPSPLVLVLLCVNILGVAQTIAVPEKDARLRHHPSILRDPDETPENPDAPDNGDRKPTEGLVNELESRLFKARKVMVFGQITDKLARDVVSRVLALVDESAKPIQIYVNSPGGHVESGDSIHDIIKFVRSTVPIYMIGTGWVASAGVLIYLAGENKMRFCLPNTRFLLHQPMGGVHGPATDIEIEARELVKMHERLVQIIATDTGQSVERVRKDTDRNYWMSASEAIDYGVANKIISSIRDLK